MLHVYVWQKCEQSIRISAEKARLEKEKTEFARIRDAEIAKLRARVARFMQEHIKRLVAYVNALTLRHPIQQPAKAAGASVLHDAVLKFAAACGLSDHVDNAQIDTCLQTLALLSKVRTQSVDLQRERESYHAYRTASEQLVTRLRCEVNEVRQLLTAATFTIGTTSHGTFSRHAKHASTQTLLSCIKASSSQGPSLPQPQLRRPCARHGDVVSTGI